MQVRSWTPKWYRIALHGDTVDPYEIVRPIMNMCGANRLSPRDFYWEVNSAYHDAEAMVYECLHSEMFPGLRKKWDRLLSPLTNAAPRSLRWLDVGCGTGLVGTHLADLIGDRIAEAVLLDPSSVMLEQCQRNAAYWPFHSCFVMGTAEKLPSDMIFDLVTVNSVLHHVVELPNLLGQLTSLVRDGGFLITCHDPRYEALKDLILKGRTYCARYRARYPKMKYRFIRSLPEPVVSLARRARRRRPVLSKGLVLQDLAEQERWHAADAVISATNDRLTRRGLLGRPLAPREIWAVTDIHVPGQPGGFGKGIKLDFLKSHLAPLEMDDYFTYGFFGSLVPPKFLERAEDTLFRKSDPHGTFFGSRWQRRTSNHSSQMKPSVSSGHV